MKGSFIRENPKAQKSCNSHYWYYSYTKVLLQSEELFWILSSSPQWFYVLSLTSFQLFKHTKAEFLPSSSCLDKTHVRLVTKLVPEQTWISPNHIKNTQHSPFCFRNKYIHPGGKAASSSTGSLKPGFPLATVLIITPAGNNTGFPGIGWTYPSFTGTSYPKPSGESVIENKILLGAHCHRPTSVSPDAAQGVQWSEGSETLTGPS